MRRAFPELCLSLLVMTVLALALPRLYDLVFAVEVAPTRLFYSPVRQAFIYREHFGDHDFIYADQHGERFDRRTFETQLPFIYYRNMALWGLLPLTLDGRTFDRRTMRDRRQVFELKPHELTDRRPTIPVYPLIETNPGQAGLRFPEDVFRMTASAIEFVNVDTNRIDPALTETFTAALRAAGFRFPAGLVAGKPTILKPFDEGYFLTDATGAVFHLRRVDGAPSVVRTPIPPDLGVRHIRVSESQQRAYYGMLLATDGRLFLISTDGYRLQPLPTDGYDPDRMSYKLLVNPVTATAVFGDDHTVRGVAMTPDFAPIARYRREVPGTDSMLYARAARVLFPFDLSVETRDSGYLGWHLDHHGWSGLIGVVLCLGALMVLARFRGTPARRLWPQIGLVAVGGVFGVAAVVLVPVTGLDSGRSDHRPRITVAT